MESIAEKGQSFCPVTFTNEIRCRVNFEQTQLFTLYFDNRKLTVEESLAKARDYNVPVLFPYDTFSLSSRIREALVSLKDFCRNEILVVHNAPFDLGFININMQ